MKYQYFIASRWRNRDIVLELTTKLREKGKTVYCFMETKENFHKPEDDPEKAMQEFESIDNWQGHKLIRDIFEVDMKALRNAKTLLLLLPAGKSAHMEAGVAYGMGKKCIYIGEQKEAESLYLIFNEHYDTIDDFIMSLS